MLTFHHIEILQHFKIESLDVKVEPINEGHIHNSFKIFNNTPSNRGYFLQKINQSVFKEVESLMTSIDLITKHLTQKTETPNEETYSTFQVIPTKDNKLFYKDSKKDYWRLYSLIADTHSFQKLESPKIAYECGKIQGRFINLLSDFPLENIPITIPHFHDLAKRWGAFLESLENDSSKRANSAGYEIEFAFQKINKLMKLHQFIEEGNIPKRITHNDTKCNNVLFNKHNKAIAVVDLDTIMPGSVLFDFGDAIRTGANTASEDEKNLQKVTLNLNIFKSYTQGFLENTKTILTQNEIAHLVTSTQFMTFIIGLRFLTDYLSGDSYFRITDSQHNLTRTRVQWKLLQELEQNEKEMHKIVMDLR